MMISKNIDFPLIPQENKKIMFVEDPHKKDRRINLERRQYLYDIHIPERRSNNERRAGSCFKIDSVDSDGDTPK